MADLPLLDDYAAQVADLEPLRLTRLGDVADALALFFASGSAFGPTSSELPGLLTRLISDSAIDAVGVMATSAAFQEADRLMAPDGFGVWAPTDEWLETRRRAWLTEHYPQVADLVAAPTTDPVASARRMAEIDQALSDLAVSGTVSVAAVDALMAEREQLVAEAAINLNALTNSINAWGGSDNDPALDTLTRARRDIIDVLVEADAAAAHHMETMLNQGMGAGEALFVAVHQQIYESRIAEVVALEGTTRAEAIEVVAQMDSEILALVEAGYSPTDAMTAAGIARATELDLDTAIAQAQTNNVGLIEALGLMATARAMDLSLQELGALGDFTEHFSAFDNATGGNTDDRVSVQDLLYVTEHPSQFTPAQVSAAQAVLDTPMLRNRLDTAADNEDLLDGHMFGNTNPGDGVIGLQDIDAFLMGTHLNNLLGDHAGAIDIAAHGGQADGTFSRNDLQTWLNDPANATVPVDVRDGVQLMLDNGMFDESWLEAHRDDLALGAAIVAGGAVIILTGGTAAPVLLTLGAGFLAGAGAAGLTTLAINSTTGADLTDGVLGNSLAGGFIGMSVAGLSATLGSVGGGFTLTNAAAISGATAEVTGIVSLGGTDLLIPEDWEDSIHATTGTISTATGAPAFVYTGGRIIARRMAPRSSAFAETADEMSSRLGVDPVFEGTTREGTTRVRWEPNQLTRITLESHPGGLTPRDVGYLPRHHGVHYHIQIRPGPTVGWNNAQVFRVAPPGYSGQDGRAFLPGEMFP